jgi:hypothetical protein
MADGGPVRVSRIVASKRQVPGLVWCGMANGSNTKYPCSEAASAPALCALAWATTRHAEPPAVADDEEHSCADERHRGKHYSSGHAMEVFRILALLNRTMVGRRCHEQDRTQGNRREAGQIDRLGGASGEGEYNDESA